MKNFPETFTPKNREKFVKQRYNRFLCYLRREIYEHVLNRKDETEYFDLNEFNQRVKNLDVSKKLAGDVTLELKKLGWKCDFSFGGTGLFIYAGDKPKNCFEDSEF